MPLLHSPWPLQLPGHVSCEQSAPHQPSSHAHVKLASHSPWPLQPARHVRAAQSAPDQPAAHSHLPLTQLPWYEQSLGHAEIEHVLPLYPG